MITLSYYRLGPEGIILRRGSAVYSLQESIDQAEYVHLKKGYYLWATFCDHIDGCDQWVNIYAVPAPFPVEFLE